MKHPLKAQGFVRTPPFIAALLARWALRTPTDHVLDAGFGEGVFLLESTRRLLALGASVQHLAAQLHGVDSHPDAVQGLQRTFRSYGLPTELPGVHTGDFFETDFPRVDVLKGLPTAVAPARQRLSPERPGVLGEHVGSNQGIGGHVRHDRIRELPALPERQRIAHPSEGPCQPTAV
jgi:hypothetical protein